MRRSALFYTNAWWFVFALAAVKHAAAKYIHYNTSASRDPTKLNVHIICHTHDDAGWLKTVDQYYYGSSQWIQVAGVQYILDTVVQQLQANKDRKFVYAEMAFFTRWWAEQSPEVQDAVKELVAAGQLGFVNGGWVQHDEAAAHYVGMVDQTTRGHTFLKETFGYIPRVGWQVDPFGHSATQASLLSGWLGFDALMFGRADYQDEDLRKQLRQMEMVWRGSESLGRGADVWVNHFPQGHHGTATYGPLQGFNWDWGGHDSPIQDRCDLHDFNVDSRVDDFVARCTSLFSQTRGNDIMVLMGTDFQFANALSWYKNLDKLIHYANLDGRLNVFYSTPEDYVAAKHGYDTAWPLKTDDFFPYADNAHSYWTGYFTSRPASKRFIRQATSYLQAARQLHLLAAMGVDGLQQRQAPPEGNCDAADGGSSADALDVLEDAVSLLQHHDAITGTEKQAVANDYHMRLNKGMVQARALVNRALERLVMQPPRSDLLAVMRSQQLPTTASALVEQPQSADTHRIARASGLALTQCPFANVSVCTASVTLSRVGAAMAVVVYNPLAQPRREVIRLPVAYGPTMWHVTDDDGQAVRAQMVPISMRTHALQQTYIDVGVLAADESLARGDHDLVFAAQLPPLGYVLYKVQPDEPREEAALAAQLSYVSTPVSPLATEGGSMGAPFTVTNGAVQLDFDASGRLVSMAAGGVSAALSMQLLWYRSSDGQEPENQGQCSGAYIFRPQGGGEVHALAEGQPLHTQVVQGDVITEVRQQWADWAHLTLRLAANSSALEVEWTVGDIPTDSNHVGRELVLRYVSDLDSGDVFYSDANGREVLKRVRNFRPGWPLQVHEPVAGNYYPLTSGIFIRQPGRAELAVSVDRAQGGSSLSSGSLEVMLHRRTVHDDWRGVGEWINEAECGCKGCSCVGLTVRGVHTVTLSPPNTAAHVRRVVQQHINDPPLVAVGCHPESSHQGEDMLRSRYSGLISMEGLPTAVHLLTLQQLRDGAVLLRLAHHLQVGEAPSNTTLQATVNLARLLAGFRVVKVTEMSLSANQRRADMRRRLFKAGDPVGPEGTAPFTTFGESEQPAASLVQQGPVDCEGECSEDQLKVVLGPMEVRTFKLVLERMQDRQDI